jgi:beta-glucosidase
LLTDYGDLADAIQPGDIARIAQPLDWIGLNYYNDILVRGLAEDEAPQGMAAYPTVTGVRPSELRPVHTDMGWPLTPEGLSNLLVRLRDEYPQLPPIYITENGAAYDDPVVDGACHDARRIEYLHAHLQALADALDRGVDLRGYFVWSLLDNFEWALGYDKRFGLVHVDFETLARTPRDSAHWYHEVIRRNGLAAAHA